MYNLILMDCVLILCYLSAIIALLPDLLSVTTPLNTNNCQMRKGENAAIRKMPRHHKQRLQICKALYVPKVSTKQTRILVGVLYDKYKNYNEGPIRKR